MDAPNSLPVFPWSDDTLAERVAAAVAVYWGTRGRQGDTVGNTFEDARGGKHMDGFVGILADLAGTAGFTEAEVRFRRGVELPGYFRPTKKWDLVVLRGNRLCAAVELKSQMGPSFGSNFNNRAEEAVGSATDLWVAHREGQIGFHPPWLGYLFLLEDTPSAQQPVKLPSTPFPVDPVFERTSYERRYAILCERLVRERTYTSACLLVASRMPPWDYREASTELGFRQFAHSFYGHLLGCA